MKTRTLVVLALLGLLLIGAALWLGAERAPGGGEPGEREKLLPTLGTQLNDVTRVRIAGLGSEAVLERVDGRWVMPDRGGWPVDTGKLRTLLLALAEAGRLEPKTANPELYPRLGVEDITDTAGTGALVEITAGDATHAVIVGNSASAGSYARLAAQPQSWLLDRAIAVEKDPAGWLEQELTQIDAQRVAAVTITPADGEPVEIVARDPGPGFDIANLPKGREPASDYVAEATAGFLSALRLADVGREGESDFGEDDDLSHTHFALHDGIVVDIDFVERDGAVLARFDPSLDEDKAQAYVAAEQAKAAMEHERVQRQAQQAAPEATDAEATGADSASAPEATAATDAAPATEAPLAVTDPEADRAARLAALREELAALEQRLEGWTFTLPPYQAEHLTKPLADYLAPEQ